MSCLYVTTHRTTYLKFSLYYFYRQLSLSTNDYRTSNPMIVPTSQFNSRTNVLGKHVVNFSKMISQSKRSVTVHMPPATEDKQSPPRNFSDRIPFQFPPGNPNDKPKLEHLRFIENQLIQIVILHSSSITSITKSSLLVTALLQTDASICLVYS